MILLPSIWLPANLPLEGTFAIVAPAPSYQPRTAEPTTQRPEASVCD